MLKKRKPIEHVIRGKYEWYELESRGVAIKLLQDEIDKIKTIIPSGLLKTEIILFRRFDNLSNFKIEDMLYQTFSKHFIIMDDSFEFYCIFGILLSRGVTAFNREIISNIKKIDQKNKKIKVAKIKELRNHLFSRIKRRILEGK